MKFLIISGVLIGQNDYSELVALEESLSQIELFSGTLIFPIRHSSLSHRDAQELHVVCRRRQQQTNEKRVYQPDN
jgi:hypothetical protein